MSKASCLVKEAKHKRTHFYDFTYMKCPEKQIYRDRILINDCVELGVRMGSNYKWEWGFLGDNENVWRLDFVDTNDVKILKKITEWHS